MTPILGNLINTDSQEWAHILDEVEKEKASLYDDLDKLKVSPVIMVGITYTF